MIQRGIECLIFVGLFPQKSPIIIGSFEEIDQQITASYASLPPRTTHGWHRVTHTNESRPTYASNYVLKIGWRNLILKS